MIANKWVSRAVILVVTILAVANYGCKGGSSDSTSPFVNVSVSPSASTVQAGTTQNVIAMVTNDVSMCHVDSVLLLDPLRERLSVVYSEWHSRDLHTPGRSASR
jgi:hypothetical protein